MFASLHQAMGPFGVSVLACLAFSLSCLAASPPDHNPNYILDPLNSTDHGILLSSNRMVLKLDCPGCPVLNHSWRTDATALIFDFTIPSNSSGPHMPSKPVMLLNNNSFLPPGRQLGWTPFTDHTFRPVPWTTRLEDYLSSPTQYPTLEAVGIVEPVAVNNSYGWNLTAVIFLTFAYGADDKHIYENYQGNVSAVEVFFRSTNTSSTLEAADGSHDTQQWSFEWWQIVSIPLLWDNRTFYSDPPSMLLPDGLRNKLLGTLPAKAEPDGSSHDETARTLGEILGWIRFFGAILIIALIGALFAVVWRFFGPQLRKAWEDLRKKSVETWGVVREKWTEWRRKDGAQDEEDAPLLAGDREDGAGDH